MKALCAVIAVLLAGATLAAETPAPARPLKIGYVDLSRVVNDYAKRIDQERALKEYQNKLTEQARIHLDELNRLAGEIEQLAMGTPERQALQERLKVAEKSSEEFRRRSVRELNERIVGALTQMYREVAAEIDRIGREEGYDFIIKDQTSDLSGQTQMEVSLQIAQRVVLYAKPEYDLTGRVVERLNDAYNRDAARGGAGK